MPGGLVHRRTPPSNPAVDRPAPFRPFLSATVMHLYLCGYRGSGKTTVATALAERLNLPVIDTDAVVVQTTGRTIADMFATDGEETFRRMEEVAVAEAAARPDPTIISLGGGAVMRVANRDRLRNTGRAVYLHSDAPTLRRRIEADSQSDAQRPALTSATATDEISEVLAIRDPVYRSVADVVIDGSQPIEDVTEAIVRWWDERPEHR